ncbi:MAG TPA: hypothetical protein VM659_05325, partial [Dongiaceae bacterium]|nr:hypothetical protein [Dongiaceae bacterium]
QISKALHHVVHVRPFAEAVLKRHNKNLACHCYRADDFDDSRWRPMKRAVVCSASLFAALCITAEARSVELKQLGTEATTLAEKLQTIRRLPQTLPDQPILEATPIQWFNWGNWSNCSNGSWRNC